jgi:capsular polysaccharide transport system permease protein
VLRVYTLFTRALFFVSGVMFVSEQFAPEYRVYLIWNPMLHLLQLVRSAYFVEYESTDANPAFALAFVVLLLLAGLAGERMARVQAAPA